MESDPKAVLLEEGSALLEDGLGLERFVGWGVVVVLVADLAGRRVHQLILVGHLLRGKLLPQVRDFLHNLRQLREGPGMCLVDFLDVPEMYLIVESMIDGLLKAAFDGVERFQLEDVLSAIRNAELTGLAVHDRGKGREELVN